MTNFMRTELAAFVVLAVAGPLAAQTELERLGGGPGGVPQWPGGQRQFFQERSGVQRRPRPHQAGQQVVEETEDAPLSIGWRQNLLTVAADGVPASIFFLELNRVTGIPVRLDPGNERTVTAAFRDIRIERALATILPAGQCTLVRRENRPVNAPDSIVGIVVKTPPLAPGETAPAQRPVIGAIHFGPHFAVPGDPPPSPAAPAIAEDTSDEKSESEPSGPPPVASAAAAVSGAAPAIADPEAPERAATRDANEVRRRMQELVEQRLKQKKSR